jgi:hypothetical protein
VAIGGGAIIYRFVYDLVWKKVTRQSTFVVYCFIRISVAVLDRMVSFYIRLSVKNGNETIEDNRHFLLYTVIYELVWPFSIVWYRFVYDLVYKMGTRHNGSSELKAAGTIRVRYSYSYGTMS